MAGQLQVMTEDQSRLSPGHELHAMNYTLTHFLCRCGAQKLLHLERDFQGDFQLDDLSCL